MFNECLEETKGKEQKKGAEKYALKNFDETFDYSKNIEKVANMKSVIELTGYMATVISVYPQDNQYYLHEVVLTKREDNMPFKTGTVNHGTPSGKLSSIYSLLQTLQNVKEKNSLKENYNRAAKMSADAITYDNNDNVIPLEKRFTESRDLRYSRKENFIP